MPELRPFPPRKPSSARAGIIAACASLLVFAFIASPRSCEWGLDAYFWFGALILLGLVATPFVRERHREPAVRLGHSLLLVALGAAVWVAGIFLANMRIMCRMF
jgi:hypothetical protein